MKCLPLDVKHTTINKSIFDEVFFKNMYILQVTDEGVGYIAKNCEKLKKINLHSCTVCINAIW